MIMDGLGKGIAMIVGMFEPLRKFVVNVGILLAIFFGAPAVYKLATKSSFVIKDISVPGALSDRGLSGEVIAQQLLDQVTEIDAVAGSRKEKADITGLDFQSSMPSIDLPVGGINITSVVTELRQLLGATETKITGEIYVATPGNDDKGTPTLFGIRLRIGGVGPIYKTQTPTANVDELIDGAAQKIMHRFDPINLGYYYYRKKDYRRAYDITEEALADSSSDNDSWAYTMRGLIARDQGRTDEAIANMREAIARADKFWVGYANLSELLLKTGNLDEAESAARKVIELAPKEQEGHSALALVLFERGKKDEALAEMRLGLSLDPKDAGGHMQLGRLQARLQMFDDALSSFRTSAALNPVAEPLVQAASVARSLKRGTVELDYLRQATQAEPKNADAWLALGEGYFARKDFPRAIEAFRKSEALDEEPTTMLRVSQLLLGERHIAEVDALFTKNAKRFAGNPDFTIGWSELLWTQGKKPEANAKLKEVLSSDAPATTYVTTGKMFEDRHEPLDAAAAYVTAVMRDPTLAPQLQPKIENLKQQATRRP